MICGTAEQLSVSFQRSSDVSETGWGYVCKIRATYRKEANLSNLPANDSQLLTAKCWNTRYLSHTGLQYSIASVPDIYVSASGVAVR